MRLSKFDQEIQTRISEERLFDFAGGFGPIERSEMLTGEEVCDGGWGEHADRDEDYDSTMLAV